MVILRPASESNKLLDLNPGMAVAFRGAFASNTDPTVLK